MGDRSLRIGKGKNSADGKPYEVDLATERRMMQTRYEPDEEYPATESRMVQTRYEPEEETYS